MLPDAIDMFNRQLVPAGSTLSRQDCSCVDDVHTQHSGLDSLDGELDLKISWQPYGLSNLLLSGQGFACYNAPSVSFLHAC